MHASTTLITVSEARAIAEENAFADLKEFSGAIFRVLKDDDLEGENCWMFFRSDEIVVPPDATLGIKWAYVVSKNGTFSMVQDFSGDEHLLQTYLQTMSNHFAKRDE